ncbi:MAG TPA: hypothetical protein DEB06_03855 [Phycisphaerales bacterium]|nr:hypothetical protein [Phycisphaerales bacterium]
MHPAPELRLLLDLTTIPTAAGREGRVIAWIERWASERPDLALRRDPSGNLILERRTPDRASRPLFITAHLDHPAFVVEQIIGPGTILASFRGGVMDPYFREARVEVFPPQGDPLRATVIDKRDAKPFPQWLIELDDGQGADALAPGLIARWALPPASIEGDLLHTDACDDLAALAASLVAFDRLRAEPRAAHVRLLFTRAEEVGFIGAIAACKHETMPKDARVIALENSRSFPTDSPIGGGPIVRVGDRLSTFSPALTGAVARVAEAIASSGGGAGGAVAPGGAHPYRWQRKLMPGGACEATAFQAWGYEATCVCLPLGNYHNMANLQSVQDGDAQAVAHAQVAREFISISDYRGMIELLVRCATDLGGAWGAEPLTDRLERLFQQGRGVLDSTPGPT